MDIVNALTGEFAPELYDLGVRIAGLEERVAELEDAAPSVTFSGEYKVDFKDFSYEGYLFTGDGADGHYKSPFDYDAGKNQITKQARTTNKHWISMLKPGMMFWKQI